MENGLAAGVFGGVVEEGRDGFVFGAPEFEDEAGDLEEVGDVGDFGALAGVGGVDVGGELEGAVEAVGEDGGHGAGLVYPLRLDLALNGVCGGGAGRRVTGPLGDLVVQSFGMDKGNVKHEKGAVLFDQLIADSGKSFGVLLVAE